MLHAYASVPGSDHIAPGQPNKINKQDAIAVVPYERGFVAVICDGCGSTPRSDIGADFGSHVLAQQVHDLCVATPKGPAPKFDWTAITDRFLETLKRYASQYVSPDDQPAFDQLVHDRLLFTAIITIQWDSTTIVAACGDGLVKVDDELTWLEPPLRDAPPYLGYRLMRDSAYHRGDLRGHLEIREVMRVNHTMVKNAICVGSDGALPLTDDPDLYHPGLLMAPGAFARWVASKTSERFTGSGFGLGVCRDDATILLIRSSRAQKTLEIERSEIKELKDRVTLLTSERDEALGKVAPLEDLVGHQVHEIRKQADQNTLHRAEIKRLKDEKQRETAEVRRLLARLQKFGIPPQEPLLNRMATACGLPELVTEATPPAVLEAQKQPAPAPALTPITPTLQSAQSVQSSALAGDSGYTPRNTDPWPKAK